MLTVRLPEELAARLARLAAATGRPKSYHVREALVDYIGDLEEHDLAEQRFREYGNAQGIPLDALMLKYGLAG